MKKEIHSQDFESWVESFEPLASPEEPPKQIFLKCPECESETLLFEFVELFKGNYILTLTCDECHNRFSTRLLTGVTFYLNGEYHVCPIDPFHKSTKKNKCSKPYKK